MHAVIVNKSYEIINQVYSLLGRATFSWVGVFAVSLFVCL